MILVYNEGYIVNIGIHMSLNEVDMSLLRYWQTFVRYEIENGEDGFLFADVVEVRIDRSWWHGQNNTQEFVINDFFLINQACNRKIFMQ